MQNWLISYRAINLKLYGYFFYQREINYTSIDKIYLCYRQELFPSQVVFYKITFLLESQ